MTDDISAYVQTDTQGLGPTRVTSYPAQSYLQSGAPVACLEQIASDFPLSLVYLQNRYLSPAVCVFYNWSRRVLQPPFNEVWYRSIDPVIDRVWSVLTSSPASSTPDFASGACAVKCTA